MTRKKPRGGPSYVSTIISAIYCIRRFRLCMYFGVAKIITTAVVSSSLDYCNSLYHNIDLKNILKLQRVQNVWARVVTRSPRFSDSVPLLKSLH